MQPQASTKFDDYAGSYEEHHRSSIAASGEDPAYFHDYKIACLRRHGLLDGPVLDYGCGVGNITERLAAPGVATEVHGFDPSAESLAEARTRAPTAVFHSEAAEIPRSHFKTAILSGVLHHVPPWERRDVLRVVRDSLVEGGHVVVFEHNPLNPVTRQAVAACAFDDDAILLWPWELRALLRDASFAEVKLDYIVFFPKPLAFLRRFEPRLRGVALGAQQMAIARR